MVTDAVVCFVNLLYVQFIFSDFLLYKAILTMNSIYNYFYVANCALPVIYVLFQLY